MEPLTPNPSRGILNLATFHHLYHPYYSTLIAVSRLCDKGGGGQPAPNNLLKRDVVPLFTYSTPSHVLPCELHDNYPLRPAPSPSNEMCAVPEFTNKTTGATPPRTRTGGDHTSPTPLACPPPPAGRRLRRTVSVRVRTGVLIMYYDTASAYQEL